MQGLVIKEKVFEGPMVKERLDERSANRKAPVDNLAAKDTINKNWKLIHL